MKDTPTKKVALILVLVIFLSIVTSMVQSLAQERRNRRAEAMQEISSSFSAQQQLETPFLLVPIQEERIDKNGKVVQSESERELHPASAELVGEAQVEPRSRGIFRAQTYEIRWSGKVFFELPPEKEILQPQRGNGNRLRALSPTLVLPIGSKKGLKRFPELKITGSKTQLKPEACSKGFCYALPMSYEQARAQLKELQVQIEASGMDEIRLLSRAEISKLSLRSNWPSPSFTGPYLPTKREITAQGFSAEWSLLRTTQPTDEDIIRVRFMEPVDIYTLTERATKYALLFFVSVFSGFFLVEVVTKLRLHTLQYALVGAALVLFYLLVLSLSEHMAFRLAYALSASASTALIWFYLAAALRDRKRSTGMGLALAALYSTLYVILSAEDYALLFGSGLAFSLLAALMVATRKLDWYQIELQPPAERK